MKKKAEPFFERAGVRSVLSSLISIFIGLLLGCLIIVIVGLFSKDISMKSLWEGIRLVLFGVFNTGRNASGQLTFGFNGVNIGNLLFRAIPLIMTGLSVAFSFRTGLFNIGAPGQFLAGTAATLFIALCTPSDIIPTWLIWILAFLGGMLAGFLWGVIPGFVKAYLNINEVLACIMTNWIAANLVSWLFDKPLAFLKNAEEYGKISYIMRTTANGVETPKLFLDKLFPGSQVNAGILVAILVAIIIFVLMSKTTFGYQLRAVGLNRDAACYAGINEKRNIVLSMAISGALAGGAAALYYLSGNTEFFWNTYQSLPAEGFNGIPVALLASSNPIGVVFAGIFMSAITVAGQQLKSLTPYNEYITDIIIAAIIYMSAFSLLFNNLLKKLFSRKEPATNINAEPDEKPKSTMEALNQATASFAKAASGAGESAAPEKADEKKEEEA